MNDTEESIYAMFPQSTYIPCPPSTNRINFIDATMQWISCGVDGNECFFPCWIYVCGAIVDGELYYCQQYISRDLWSYASGFTDKEFEKELMQDVYSAFRCKLKLESTIQ